MTELTAIFTTFSITSMLLRLCLAAFISGAIGLEREKKRRPAGFRTYLLVGCGATVTALIGQYLVVYWSMVDPAIAAGVDPSRISAQVINGIGFLGAGTIIITEKEKVKGLTTAAGLWTTAVMGLAVGIGSWYTALVGFILVMLALRVEPFVEEFFIKKARNINVYVEMYKISDMHYVISEIKNMGIKVYDFELINRKNTAAAVLYLRIDSGMTHDEVVGAISEIRKISRIEEM